MNYTPKDRNNYNTSMRRVAEKHHISYPSFDEVIAYLGEKPNNTEHYTYILAQTRDYTKPITPKDFFWNRRLTPSILNKAYSIYKNKTSRQQVKKALQKLSYEEINDVLSRKKRYVLNYHIKKLNQNMIHILGKP